MHIKRILYLIWLCFWYFFRKTTSKVKMIHDKWISNINLKTNAECKQIKSFLWISSATVHTNFTNKLKRLVLTDEFYLFHQTSNANFFIFIFNGNRDSNWKIISFPANTKLQIRQNNSKFSKVKFNVFFYLMEYRKRHFTMLTTLNEIEPVWFFLIFHKYWIRVKFC